jgi:hypothetical protein
MSIMKSSLSQSINEIWNHNKVPFQRHNSCGDLENRKSIDTTDKRHHPYFRSELKHISLPAFTAVPLIMLSINHVYWISDINGGAPAVYCDRLIVTGGILRIVRSYFTFCRFNDVLLLPISKCLLCIHRLWLNLNMDNLYGTFTW